MSDFIAQHLAVKQQMLSPGAPFEVSTIRINGRDVPAYKNAQGTLSDIINMGRQHADNLFLQYQGDAWTFNQFFEQVDRYSAILQSHYHITKGERVAIAMRNRPEWLVAFCAIINIGGVAVPLNSWGKSEELHQGLGDSDAKFVICDRQRYDYISPDSFGIDALLVDADTISSPRTRTLNDFDDISITSQPVELSQQDDAILMFTSGTGGRPKGAVFTHFNCVQALFNIDYIGATTYMTHTDKINAFMARSPSKTLLAVPLFHISGLFSQGIANLKGGRSIYMMYKWDVDEAIRVIKTEKITVLMGASTMMLDLLGHDAIKNVDVSNISNISAGGSGTPAKLNQLYNDILPDTMAGAGWGLTETAGTGAAFTGTGFQQNPSSAGFVSPIAELKFCDDNGESLPAGTAGEIYIKSAACIDHYLDGIDREDFAKGWFKTGDIGYVDEHGLLYLCDRAKDMIIRGGENIYPVEVENCIIQHPSCQEAAVIGIDDDTYGEVVAAVVVLKNDQTCTESELQAHCQAHLAHFKVPSKIVFSSSLLPRNPTKKLLKKQIKQLFFGN